MMLREHWLTLALSLFLPSLAWVEAQADLPPLRKVALAVAAVVLIRLLLNWYVLDYAFGGLPVADGLLLAYGVPAAAFALAAAMFRRRSDDLTVGVLEAGSVAFVTVLVALEIRHAAGQHEVAAAVLHFPEAAQHVAALAVLAVATMRIATRLDRPVLHWGWRVQGALALAGGALLILANPIVTGEPVGRLPLLDWLLPAYLLPACLAVLAIRHAATAQPAWLRRVLAGYALLAGFAWISLEVRHLFHPGAMDDAGRSGDRCRVVGLVRRMAGLWRGADGGRDQARREAAAAGGAGDHRADRGQGVPGGHVRPGRPVARGVVPRAGPDADQPRARCIAASWQPGDPANRLDGPAPTIPPLPRAGEIALSTPPQGSVPFAQQEVA